MEKSLKDRVWEVKDLSRGERLTLIALFNYSDENGNFQIPMMKFCQIIGFCREYVRDMLSNLVKMRYIKPVSNPDAVDKNPLKHRRISILNYKILV